MIIGNGKSMRDRAKNIKEVLGKVKKFKLTVATVIIALVVMVASPAFGQGAVCPKGNVKLEVGSGRLEYDDGSAELWGGPSQICWKKNPYFVVTGVCGKIEGPGGGSLKWTKGSQGCFGPFDHNFSHAVVYTQPGYVPPPPPPPPPPPKPTPIPPPEDKTTSCQYEPVFLLEPGEVVEVYERKCWDFTNNVPLCDPIIEFGLDCYPGKCVFHPRAILWKHADLVEAQLANGQLQEGYWLAFVLHVLDPNAPNAGWNVLGLFRPWALEEDECPPYHNYLWPKDWASTEMTPWSYNYPYQVIRPQDFHLLGL